jgi:RNA polymerase sigma-70 factor, ECF subfamily
MAMLAISDSRKCFYNAAEVGNDREEDRSSMTNPDTIVSSPSQVRDAELLAQIARGDETALGALYDRHVRLIFAIALRITGDRETAEEVVQDVFQHIWISARAYSAERGGATSWLSAITRHRAIDITRSRRERARAREETLDPLTHGGETPPPDQEVDTRLLREQIRSALSTLPANQRQAIELAYYGGLTRAEIAQATGEPLGTVKTRLRLGLTKLRDLIHPPEE